MATNPAGIGGNRTYKQGLYIPVNPSKYMGDVNKIVYRSSWEFKVCYKLDHADYVVGWACEQPVVPYISPKDGLPHRYFPDFLVVTLNQDGTKNITMIEVKPYREQFPPTAKGKKKSRFLKEAVTYEVNQAKWRAARAFCDKRGWNFVILTEKEILNEKK